MVPDVPQITVHVRTTAMWLIRSPVNGLKGADGYFPPEPLDFMHCVWFSHS